VKGWDLLRRIDSAEAAAAAQVPRGGGGGGGAQAGAQRGKYDLQAADELAVEQFAAPGCAMPQANCIAIVPAKPYVMFACIPLPLSPVEVASWAVGLAALLMPFLQGHLVATRYRLVLNSPDCIIAMLNSNRGSGRILWS